MAHTNIDAKAIHLNNTPDNKKCEMNKFRQATLDVSKMKPKFAIEVQKGFLAFTEKPSDKYVGQEDVISEPHRINAFELFSLFTAEIIKKKAIFVR